MKLFKSARIAGNVAQLAALRATYQVMPRRQLRVELGRVERKLVLLVNSGPFDEAEYNRLVMVRDAIKAAQ